MDDDVEYMGIFSTGSASAISDSKTSNPRPLGLLQARKRAMPKKTKAKKNPGDKKRKEAAKQAPKKKK